MAETLQPSLEFVRAELGDARLTERAVKTVEALLPHPDRGFPKVLTSCELEGYYRLVNNEKVTFCKLLAAHIGATRERLQPVSEVIVAEDTTDFRFSDEVPRAGLGPMDNGGQGFYAHFALAIVYPGQVMGVVGVEPWVRSAKPEGAKQTQRERYLAADKESLRWARMVESVEKEFAGGPSVIHVMDREADDYDLIAHMVQHRRRCVIRSATDRRLSGAQEGQKLRAFLSQVEVACTRTAELSSRPKKGRPAKELKKYPPRKRRMANLAISGESVTLRRPDKSSKDLPESLDVNVVYVNEPEPPEGSEPVQWVLYTNEPIDTEAQLLRVVDIYRQRWLIEEYFKALKSGCAIEKRQHETKSALLNALAIFIPIAWSLLNLRYLSRRPESAARPASELLTPVQLDVLRAKSAGRLPASPTIREAMLAIARYLGGHIKGNGEPGWQVLGRGYQELLLGEMYWRLALLSVEGLNPEYVT